MTATTSILSAPSTAHSRPALWTALALFAGGALMGVAGTLIISDDDAPAVSASTAAEAQFRDASAAEASRYVESLEDASIVVPVEVHPSADAAERWATAESTVQPGAYAHGFDYSDQPGTCTLVTRTPC
jgi:hypothetical protein